MKKYLILILGFVFLTGCSMKEQTYDVNTIHYDLNISNYYQENITFTFPSNAYELAVANEEEEYDSLEYILLLDNFSRPIQNNIYTMYGKNVFQLDQAVEVDLKFDYLEKDFVHSNYMNTCFENHSIVDNDDYFEINLSGEFYCLQDKVLTINVSSDYAEEVTNGVQVGDSFQWIIDSNNQDHVSIYYKVFRDKDNMATAYGTISQKSLNTDHLAIIEFFVIVLVLVLGFLFYKFLYNRENHIKKRKRKKR